MKRTPRMVHVLLFLLASVAFTGVAQAVVLAPGGNIALAGTSANVRPELAGLVKQDFTPGFVFDPAPDGYGFAGVLQGRVVQSDDLGTMIFSPRLRDYYSDSTGWMLMSLTMKGYAGWSCDVDYSVTSLGTVGPGSASRSADGDAITFSFAGDPVMSGEESRFVFNLTDAPAYVVMEDAIEMTFMNLQQLTQTITLDYYAPIPEPATLAMLALGGLLLRRRMA